MNDLKATNVLKNSFNNSKREGQVRYNKYILLYKMILSLCVQAGQRKLPDLFAKFVLGVIDSSMEIVRKIVKFYVN